jgi:DNA-directed RNA polymerase subunit omega
MFIARKKHTDKYIIDSHRDSQRESHQLTYKTEELLYASENRFKITIKVAERAKRRKYEDIDIIEDPLIKPVIRAILEMVDEMTQPEIIGE